MMMASRRVIENLWSLIYQLTLPLADEVGMNGMLACKLIYSLHTLGRFQGDLEFELAGVMVSFLGHLIDPPLVW
jgi:hypothetical protein